MARRREDYVGEWLPEPLVTSPDVAEDVELAESVSIAMLTVLETLGPAERAVFVLREVFDTPYDEIAEAVGKTPAAVRQIAHRARDHVAARRPRMQVSTTEQQRPSTGSSPPSATVTCNACSSAGSRRRPRRRRRGHRPRRPSTDRGRRTGGRLLIGGARTVDFEAKAVWLNGAPAIRHRHRRPGRHRGEPRRRERTHHPHLRRPQPPKLARLDSAAALTRT